MQYHVFTQNLKLTQYEDSVALNMRLKDFPVEPVKDNYDQHRDFGFYHNDDINSRNHALQTIAALQDDSLSPSQKEVLKRTTCKDLKNYMMCMDSLIAGDDRFAPKIMEAIALFDYEEEMLDIIWEYYVNMVKDDEGDQQDIDTYYIPDYSQLYIKIGDRALFIKENLTLAMKCYAAADLDWYRLRTDDSPFEISNDRKEFCDHWHRQYKYLQLLVSEKASEMDIETDVTLPDSCRQTYIDYRKAKRTEDYHKIWQAANEYYSALIDSLSSMSADDVIPQLRSRFILAHLIRRKTLLEGLLCISEEDKTLKRALSEDIYQCICHYAEEKLFPIQQFATSQDWSIDIMEQVLLFAETLYLTKIIRNELLVTKPLTEIAYYTSLDTFFLMLPVKAHDIENCGRLSVMNIAYMNDPNEGKTLQKFIFPKDEHQQIQSGRKSAKYPYVFMKCFTSRIDDLPMWEMYGKRAEGCCLILDWETCVKEKKEASEVPLYRVCYINKGSRDGYKVRKGDNPNIPGCGKIYESLLKLRKIGKGFLKSQKAMEVFLSILEDILYLFKDSNYHYEQEMRIYYNFQTSSERFRYTPGEYPLLYVQPDFHIHLKEILLGPKFKNVSERMPYIQNQVELMCDKIHAAYPKITMSGIEYK